jgi:hypothetical protein
MIKYFFVLIIGLMLFSCGSEPTPGKKEKKKSAPPETNQDSRISAVEVNNLLTLSQAQTFVLVDSLLNLSSMEEMKKSISGILIEIMAIKQNVEMLESDLEGAQEFKAAVMSQIDFVVLGLKNDIPHMIKMEESYKNGGKEFADGAYFKWVEDFQTKSQKIVEAQSSFVKNHNIRLQ